ncbi:MAG: hypothetical protein WAN44_09795, partial [Propionibacteriaceae bacterium]
RLQLVVATTDQAYANPVQPAEYDVKLAGEPAVSKALRRRRVVRRRRSPTSRVRAAPSGKHPVWPAMPLAFFLINRRASAPSRCRRH